jgi:hypothetical protein
MFSEKTGGDAIFIKLGWLEISAVGQVAIAALVLLALLYFGSRLFLRLRKG